MPFEVVCLTGVDKTLICNDMLLIYMYSEIAYNKYRVMVKHHYINTVMGLKEVKMEIFERKIY